MANRRFAPMGPGLETDIDTGEPLAVVLDDREATRQAQQLKRLDRHYALLADLTGNGGPVLQKIAQKLIERIDLLVEADPEAQTLRALLRDLQADLQIGERLVREELAAVLAREGQP